MLAQRAAAAAAASQQSDKGGALQGASQESAASASGMSSAPRADPAPERARKRCPYCGSPNLTTYDTDDRIQIVCDNCGSNVYVDSQLTVEEDFTAIYRIKGNAVQRHRRASRKSVAASSPVDQIIDKPPGIKWCPETIKVKKAEMKGVAVVSALYAILNEQRRFLTQECGCPNAIDPCSVLRSFLNAIHEQAESDEGEPDSDAEKWTTMLSMPFTLAACYIAVRQNAHLDKGGGLTTHDVLELARSGRLIYLHVEEFLEASVYGDLHMMRKFLFRIGGGAAKCPSSPMTVHSLAEEIIHITGIKVPTNGFSLLHVGTRVLTRCAPRLHLSRASCVRALKYFFVLAHHPDPLVRFVLQAHVRGPLGVYALVLLALHMYMRESQLVLQINALGGVEKSESCSFVEPTLLAPPPNVLPWGIARSPSVSVKGIAVLFDQLRRDSSGATATEIKTYLDQVRTKGGRISPANAPFSAGTENKDKNGDVAEKSLQEYADWCLARCAAESQNSAEWEDVLSKATGAHVVRACVEVCRYESKKKMVGDYVDAVGQLTCYTLLYWFSQQYSVQAVKSRDGAVRAKTGIKNDIFNMQGRPVRHIIDTYIHMQILNKLLVHKEFDSTIAPSEAFLTEIDAAISPLASVGARGLRIVKRAGRGEENESSDVVKNEVRVYTADI